MKKTVAVKFTCIMVIVALTITVFTTTPVLAETKSSNEDFSYITLDSTFSTYKNINGFATVNGVKLGKEQGINLKAGTQYAVSFRYRLEERNMPVNGNDYDDTGYSCRTPLVQVYKSGDGISTSTPATTGELLNSSGKLNVYTAPLNEWHTYTFSFTTDSVQKGNTWFALVTYGGFKSSYSDFTITPYLGQTCYYTFDSIKNIPEYGDINASVFQGTPKNSSDLYPYVAVTTTRNACYITLDTTQSVYISPNGSGNINGIKIGKNQGISLESSQTYTIEFQYRVDRRLSIEDGGNSDQRSPMIQFYKNGDGKTPSLAENMQGENLNSAGRLKVYDLPVGAWYTYSFSFIAADQIAGSTWLALVTYGGVCSSFRNLVITNQNGEKTFYSLGKLEDYSILQSATYDNTHTAVTAKYPSLKVSNTFISMPGDCNGDGTVNIVDMIRLKKYLADFSATTINQNSADMDTIIGVDARDMLNLKKRLLSDGLETEKIYMDNTVAVQNEYLGFNAISQCFMFMDDAYDRAYTDGQITAELERIQNTNVKMLRTYYDQGFAAQKGTDGKIMKDTNGNLVWNWESNTMKGVYQWLDAMKQLDITVILNMSWGANILSESTIFGQDNPFYGMTVEQVTAAYADWASKSLEEIVVKRGYDNVKFIAAFTEPYVGIGLTGRKLDGTMSETAAAVPGALVSQTDWYVSAIAALDNKLKEDNIRNIVKIIGPDVALRDDINNAPGEPTISERIAWWTEGLGDYVDIYAFHWYAPSYPDTSTPVNNIEETETYNLQSSYLSKITPSIAATGKQLWFDELNYIATNGGEYLHDNVQKGWSGTQLANLLIANMNAGIQNNLLWSLNDMQWPLRDNTGGEFVNGVHMTGIYPTLRDSLTPYKQYYAYTLFSKYFNSSSSASVYRCTDYGDIHAVALKQADGSYTVAVVNSSQSVKKFVLEAPANILPGSATLYRHLYDPATVMPDESASIIAADKTLNINGTQFSDILPAGGVAIYTTIH